MDRIHSLQTQINQIQTRIMGISIEELKQQLIEERDELVEQLNNYMVKYAIQEEQKEIENHKKRIEEQEKNIIEQRKEVEEQVRIAKEQESKILEKQKISKKRLEIIEQYAVRCKPLYKTHYGKLISTCAVTPTYPLQTALFITNNDYFLSIGILSTTDLLKELEKKKLKLVNDACITPQVRRWLALFCDAFGVQILAQCMSTDEFDMIGRKAQKKLNLYLDDDRNIIDLY